mmetsp:Transcript_22524/g.33522  ORF Transcript_22524/g.33522 Transcript_22524/m.33522 type:complete len:256 (-) Transcript_22524:230-997(-)
MDTKPIIMSPQRRQLEDASQPVASQLCPSLNAKHNHRNTQIEAYARLATEDKNEFLKLKAELKRVGYTSMCVKQAMHALADARSDSLEVERNDNDGMSRRWQWTSRWNELNHKSLPILPSEKRGRNLNLVRNGDGRASMSSCPDPGRINALKEKFMSFGPTKIIKPASAEARPDQLDKDQKTEYQSPQSTRIIIKEGRYRVRNGKFVLTSNTSDGGEKCIKSIDETAQAIEDALARRNSAPTSARDYKMAFIKAA